MTAAPLRMTRIGFLALVAASVPVVADASQRPDSGGPTLRKATWAETMVASRQRLAELERRPGADRGNLRDRLWSELIAKQAAQIEKRTAGADLEKVPDNFNFPALPNVPG